MPVQIHFIKTDWKNELEEEPKSATVAQLQRYGFEEVDHVLWLLREHFSTHLTLEKGILAHVLAS